MSVAPVPLLQPRVSAQVVAVGLPEAGLVLVAELEPANPLRALPEVEVGDEQPRRAAVLRVEGLAVVAVGDPRLAVGDVLKRQVRRVPAVAEGHHVRRFVLDVLQKRVDGDAFPDRGELRPLRDAVDVLRDRLARQLPELVPGPADRLGATPDRERPLLERRVRRGPGGQDREVVRQVLAGRDAVGWALAPPALESTRDDAHVDILAGAAGPRLRV